MKSCPSALALDNWDLHRQDASVAAHLVECEACRRRMSDRRRDIDHFRDNYLSIVRQRVQDAAVAPQRRSLVINKPLLWLAPLAVAAGFALLAGSFANKPNTSTVGLSKAPEKYVGSKGGASIDIVGKRGQETFTVATESSVLAGDQLRFIPRGIPADYRYFQLGALNGGAFQPLYPASIDEESIPLPEPGRALPGAIVLDKEPGPERIFVLLTKHRVSASWAARAAREAPNGPMQERRFQDTDAIAGWIVLDKR